MQLRFLTNGKKETQQDKTKQRRKEQKEWKIETRQIKSRRKKKTDAKHNEIGGQPSLKLQVGVSFGFL